MTNIVVSDLSLGYPAHGGASAFAAVEGVSFEVPDGQALAVLGESGSGKSTLLRYLAGRSKDSADRGTHLRVLSGSASVLGEELSSLRRKSQREFEAKVGFLPQDAGAKLNPDFSVADLFMQPMVQRFKKFDAEAHAERMTSLLEHVSLPLDVLEKFPHQLSKGQRQRVAVVQSLALTPKVLILDEPTMGIDPTNRPLVIDLIDRYLAEQRATMLVISHDIALLERLVDAALVMQQGAAVGFGDINEIFGDPEHVYVQRLAEALRSNAYDEVSDG